MDIFATIYDNVHKRLMNVSDIIEDISISSFIFDQPTKLTCSLRKVDNLAFWEGATLSIVIDDAKVFRGIIFTKSRTEDVNLIKIVAYDQLRYLKNSDSFIFKYLTSDKIFSRICEEYVLKYKVVDSSNYVCPPIKHTNKSLYEMIKNALDRTLINANEFFIIRDAFGELQHISITSLDSGLVLGDRSGVSGLDYESSIDNDTYTQVKLYKEVKEGNTTKNKIYTINDTINGGGNLKKWGVLQLHEKVDENLTLNQIEQKGIALLNYYNRVQRRLTLSCLGSFKVFAGATIRCQIEDLGDISVNSKLLVTECTHTIKNKEHTMKLKLEMI